MTGAILSTSRAMGEAAPVLMISGALFLTSVPESLMDDFTVLPLQIYSWMTDHRQGFHPLAASGIIVLLLVLFGAALPNVGLLLVWSVLGILGLLVNIQGAFVPLQDAVIDAAAGYLVLWAVYWGFKLLTGKEGMGYGDFKLLAALAPGWAGRCCRRLSCCPRWWAGWSASP